MKKKALYVGLILLGSCFSVLKAQETAPNDIPVPWYSQKIGGYPYAHCSLASSLMVYDYFKGMTADSCRTATEAEAKLIEYQKNYFLKKRAPFKRRTSVGQGGYYSFEIDSLTRHYEQMVSAEHFMNKDYRTLKAYIDRGIPVLINVRHRGSSRGMLQPGNHRHWVVLRGMDDTHVWINDPGRSATMRSKGENRRFPIRRERGNPAWMDGCWTGRYIVITPRIPLAIARAGKLPAVGDCMKINPPVIPWEEPKFGEKLYHKGCAPNLTEETSPINNLQVKSTKQFPARKSCSNLLLEKN